MGCGLQRVLEMQRLEAAWGSVSWGGVFTTVLVMVRVLLGASTSSPFEGQEGGWPLGTPVAIPITILLPARAKAKPRAGAQASAVTGESDSFTNAQEACHWHFRNGVR